MWAWWSGRFLGIIGWIISVFKSNQLDIGILNQQHLMQSWQQVGSGDIDQCLFVIWTQGSLEAAQVNAGGAWVSLVSLAFLKAACKGSTHAINTDGKVYRKYFHMFCNRKFQKLMTNYSGGTNGLKIWNDPKCFGEARGQEEFVRSIFTPNHHDTMEIKSINLVP